MISRATRFFLWTMIWSCLAGMICSYNALAQESSASSAIRWTDDFNLSECSFSTTGKNRFFILEPGYQLTLAGMEDEDSVLLVITVLPETEMVDGVETRVVEERESVNGHIVEISRNFYAFCQTYQSVFYFGEDVDMYEDDELIGHGGSWRAGIGENRPGLMMPGQVLLGSSYYQEIAPDEAMDRARIISDDATLGTPAGKFEHCLKTEETTPLEPDALEYKVYAPGIGLIKDGELMLVKSGMMVEGNK